jgi:hypothetical protein
MSSTNARPHPHTNPRHHQPIHTPLFVRVLLHSPSRLSRTAPPHVCGFRRSPYSNNENDSASNGSCHRCCRGSVLWCLCLQDCKVGSWPLSHTCSSANPAHACSSAAHSHDSRRRHGLVRCSSLSNSQHPPSNHAEFDDIGWAV